MNSYKFRVSGFGFRGLLLALCACVAFAGEAVRAGQEARALAAVAALPDGPKREAGLRIVRQVWQQFRDEAKAAEQPPAEGEPPRLAELRQRNASLAALRKLSGDQGRQAITALVEAHLERWPLDDEARNLLGLGRLEAGDRDGALNALIAIQACDPAAAAARELRGRLYVDDSDPDTAARAAADLAPLVARLLADGCATEEAGDATAAQRALAALEPLAKAVRGPVATGTLAALRAAAAERAEDWSAALELWRTAAAAGIERPDPAPHLRALVRRLRAGEVDPAIAAGDVTALTELSPAFPERDDLQDRLFRLLLTRGQLAAARDAGRALVAADPTHPLGLLVTEGAQAGVDPRRLELLPPVLLKLHLAAPALGARFPVVYGLDAALTEAAGDPAGAAVALDPLLAAQPGDRGARWQRARLRLVAGDHAGSIADCDALLADQANDADTLALRARAKAAAGDRTGALADIDRLVVLRPGAATLLARARVRRQLGDAAGVAADLAAMTDAATDAGDTLALMDALDLTEDAVLQRRLLEKASLLGNAQATQRLRRMR